MLSTFMAMSLNMETFTAKRRFFPLQNVREVRAQAPEHDRPDHQGAAGKDPEHQGHAPVLPEPLLVYEALPVSLNDVECRIELQKELERRGQPLQVPED